ncbi:20763_t:CDS:2 [Gigaspora rosea]|nr:20763_t:CDS:2 [Gigaspora rosea]
MTAILVYFFQNRHPAVTMKNISKTYGVHLDDPSHEMPKERASHITAYSSILSLDLRID